MRWVNTSKPPVRPTANLLPAFRFGDERAEKGMDPSFGVRDLVNTLRTEGVHVTDALEMVKKRYGRERGKERWFEREGVHACC